VIDSQLLLDDLKVEVTKLEDDLRARCDAQADVDAPLKAQYEAARAQKRTALTYKAWRDEELTNVAVAWVLACVFVRFLEDNDLVETLYLAGPDQAGVARARDQHELFFRQNPKLTEREYLEHVFKATEVLPGMKEFFDRRHNPLWSVGPTGDAAAEFVNFWRKTDPETGRPLHDFSDPTWATRFLGDLYQDLSAAARKRYALLQTPVFVEEFILDRTLTPAIETFGFREVRMIDPTCGSGHFLLGGFARLHKLWLEAEPAQPSAVLAQRALDQVFGVDLNPNVVAIARFRLLIAALRATGTKRLRDAFNFQINVTTGDALLHGRRFGEFEQQGATQRTFDTEEVFRDELKHHYEVEDTEALRRILGQQYHAVVGNPPYIRVKDRAISQLYRDRYPSCSGKYSLSVPFVERFFDLALNGDCSPQCPGGFTGQITANSFMKREFGKKLIEEFIVRWDLTHVVGTADAFIPGHTTPTVILFGRNQPPPANSTIRTVLSIRGEPSEPVDPAQGLVWKAICQQIDNPGSQSEWISVADSPRSNFSRHPWSIGGGGASELKEELDEQAEQSLGQFVDQLRGKPNIGITAFTLEDDAYIQPEHVLRRHGLDSESIRTMIEGDNLRDWMSADNDSVVWPYNRTFNPIREDITHPALRLLWLAKTNLSNNFLFGKRTKVEAGLRWYEFGRLTAHKLKTPLSITWGEQATHNHFVLDRGGSVFKNSAQVIKLKQSATEDDHLTILGILNSSTACFWLKQVCQPKATVTGDISSEKGRPEANRYAFNASAVARFPLPDLTSPATQRIQALTRQLDLIACRLSEAQPAAVLHRWFSNQESGELLPEILRESAAIVARQRALAILFQEEIDWAVYELFGLCNESPIVGIDQLLATDGIDKDSRPFQWESRTAPKQLPVALHASYIRRRELLETDERLRLLENEVCKRPWLGRQGVYGSAPATHEEKLATALRAWLVGRLEGYFFEGHRVAMLDDRFDPSASGFKAARQPALSTTSQLAGTAQADAAFLAVAEQLMGGPGFSVTKLVRELVESASVPFLPVQRYKPSGLRKRRDWEHVWELQRRGDAIDAAEMVNEANLSEDVRAERQTRAAARKRAEIGEIPVPPKYKDKDFKKGIWWSMRGKLDVPKERWVLYPGAERSEDPSPVIAWAGWDHAQQARALAEYYYDAKQNYAFPPEKLKPLLAGLADLLPWLQQWHSAIDPVLGDSPARAIKAFLDAECHELGITIADLEVIRLGN
jgi:hypothetical protein